MPELPEAEVVARQIQQGLLGARLRECWVGRADIVREGLETRPWYGDSQLTSVRRRGKSVVLGWSRGEETRYLVAELGMTGLLLFQAPHQSYDKHIHLTLSFDVPRDVPRSGGAGPTRLHYWNPRRFGRIYLLTQERLNAFLARRFGVDPLTVSWEGFSQVLRDRRGRVKALLMHQQVVAGIGNIYANEILFRAGLHPDRLASTLRPPAASRLYEVMQTVLREAIEAGGSSIRDFLAPDTLPGTYQRQHLIYGKANHPCPRCGRRIRRLRGDRSSFICSHCQRR
jgi:formamidopyrimidine-DNA glycosylase